MHEAGYVHRDIKPGNLMLRAEDGSAVVLDFGAARQAVGQRSRAITSILTPGYAPVEQYDGKVDRVGAWTDIYALGMVAYRCISGISDSELPDAVSRMLAQSRGDATLLPAVEAGESRYNPDLLEAIDWAMEVNEHDRPQGVEAWQRALSGGGRRNSPAKPVRKSAAQSTRGTTTGRNGPSWTTFALTIAIIALLGAGAWWGMQEYPQLFDQGSDATQQSAQQAATTDVPGETLQETESGETGEAVVRTEQAPPPEKADAEQPASREPALSPEEAEVARLLAAAEADLKARRLTSPAGNNAWDNYQRVLELVPAHPEAVRGMERVIESYMELFGTAVEQEDFDKAAGYLAKIGELHPDSPVLEEGEQRLKNAKQGRVDRLAEQERQRQAELERQRIANAIKEHWTAFETAIQAKDLSEAAAILNQLRTLDPEEPGLTTGEQRLEALRAELERQRAEVIHAHWAVFDTALAAEDLDEAAGILDEVRNLNPEEPGLMAGQQRLVSLERQLMEQAIKEHWAAFEMHLDERDFGKATYSLTQLHGLNSEDPGVAEARHRLAEVQRQATLERDLAGEMVFIPAGTFKMGDLIGDQHKSQRPVHTVTVPAFRIGKYEVTFDQWDACVADGGCGGYRPDDEDWGRGNRPVVNVSWDDTQAFIDWLNDKTGGNFRLPTEAEWEYAARAGNTTKYGWGDILDYSLAATEYVTLSVGSFPANAWGLHDMVGNVWEWVQDCWNDSYVGAPSDGRAWESGDCKKRILRGGGVIDDWSHSGGFSPMSIRSYRRQSKRTLILGLTDQGFRLAQDK